MRSEGRGAQLKKRPNTSLLYVDSRKTELGEHIETDSAPHKVIRIRAIRCARRLHS